MFSVKFIRLLALSVLCICASLFFTACNRDNNTPNPGENPYVLSLGVQGSDGSFTYYTVPFNDVMSGTLSAVGQGIEQPGYYDFTQIDNTIYSMGGLGDVNVVGITKNEDGSLRQIGDVSYTTGLADIVKADDNTLIALEMAFNSDVIRFHTLNATTLRATSTKQHPVSAITTQSVPFYSGMRISGNHLFLSYYIANPTTFATPNTNEAEIAVFSYPGLEFQKVIKDTRTGPVGGFNTKSGLIKNERGDVYALSHSNPANGFSQSTKPAGILRINSGSSAFDPSYFFDVDAITGGKTIAHIMYLGNGKAFVEVNTASRNAQAAWSDAPLRSAIIDLNAKTINYINGVPEHAGGGRRLPALYHENHVYMAVPEASGIYVYRMDVNNYTATKGAEVEANFVAGFFKF